MRAKKVRPVHRKLVEVLRDLKPENLALRVLHGAFQSIGKNESYTDAAETIGNSIRMECLAANVLKHDPNLYKLMEKRARAKGGPAKRRDAGARAAAERLGYKTEQWTERLRVEAGNWAINQLLRTLPQVFARDDDTGQEKYLTLTPEADAHANSFIEDLLRRNPIWLPEAQPPRPWTQLNEGGTWEPALQKSLPLVRSWNEQTARAVELAVADGTMKPALDALNALQAVPWKINKRVIEVIRKCSQRGIRSRDCRPLTVKPERPPKT